MEARWSDDHWPIKMLLLHCCWCAWKQKSTYNALTQFSVSGKLGSLNSPAGTNDTFINTSSGTPMLVRTSNIFFLNSRRRLLKKSSKVLSLSCFLGRASANFIGECEYHYGVFPKRDTQSFGELPIVSKSSLRNRLAFNSVQKRNRSGSISLGWILLMYSSSPDYYLYWHS